MSNQTFNEALVARVSSGTQISNTTTETILVPDFTIPAGYMYQGRWLRGRLRGKCSNVVTTPGTLTYRIRIGPTTLSTVSVTASAALGLDTAARTDFGWAIDFDIICQTAGTGGTVMVMGNLEQNNLLTTTLANAEMLVIPQSAPAATTIDTTVANLLSISAQFSVATNPTNITATQYFLESLT